LGRRARFREAFSCHRYSGYRSHTLRAGLQLVTHFGGWETEEAMLRSYEFGAPLQGSDRDTLPAEAIADLICKGLWPLGALYGGSSTRGPPPRRNGQRTS